MPTPTPLIRIAASASGGQFGPPSAGAAFSNSGKLTPAFARVGSDGLALGRSKDRLDSRTDVGQIIGWQKRFHTDVIAVYR